MPAPIWRTRQFQSLLSRLHRLLIHFLSWKMLPHASTTKSIRNKSLRQYSRMLFSKKFQRFRLWSRYRNKLLSPSKCFHKSVCNCTPQYKIMHVPFPHIQEQSASTVNSQFPITAVEASQVVDSFSLSEEFAAPAEVTTLDTSCTSTSSCAPMRDVAHATLPKFMCPCTTM